jgi:hypothetical protein
MNLSTKSGFALQQDPDVSREIIGELYWWKRPKGMDQLHRCQNPGTCKTPVQFENLKVHFAIR